MPGNALHCRMLFRSLRTRWKKRIQRTMQSISCLKIIWCWCKCLRAQAANYCINSIQRQWWCNHTLLCEDLHNIINPVENPSSVRPHVISGMNLLPLSSYRGIWSKCSDDNRTYSNDFFKQFQVFQEELRDHSMITMILGVDITDPDINDSTQQQVKSLSDRWSKVWNWSEQRKQQLLKVFYWGQNFC